MRGLMAAEKTKICGLIPKYYFGPDGEDGEYRKSGYQDIVEMRTAPATSGAHEWGAELTAASAIGAGDCGLVGAWALSTEHGARSAAPFPGERSPSTIALEIAVALLLLKLPLAEYCRP